MPDLIRLEILHICVMSLYYSLSAYLVMRFIWKPTIPFQNLCKTMHWSEKARLLYPARANLTFLIIMIIIAIAIPYRASETCGYVPIFIEVIWFCFLSYYIVTRVSHYFWLQIVPDADKYKAKSSFFVVLILYFHVFTSLFFLWFAPSSLFYYGFWAITYFAVNLTFLYGNVFIASKLGVVSHSAEIQNMIPREFSHARAYIANYNPANAFAFRWLQAIFITHKLQKILTLDEIKSVVDHELAHLQEKGKAKWLRNLGVWIPFVCANIYVLCRIGSLSVVQSAIPLFFFLVMYQKIATKQFRKSEEQADNYALAQEKDEKNYAHALEKMYACNLIPAVSWENTIHPHLYDRMLEANVVPNFPRPLPPSKKKYLTGLLITTMPFLFLFLLPFFVTKIHPHKTQNALYTKMVLQGIQTRDVYELANLYYRSNLFANSAAMYAFLSKHNSIYGDYATALAALSYAYCQNRDKTLEYWSLTQKKKKTSITLQNQKQWLDSIELAIQNAIGK